MLPNNNYYEMYHVEPFMPDVTVWDYGYSYLVIKICHDIGLLEKLSNAFGKCAMDILVIASYIIREGNAMDGIDDWLQRNYFPNYKQTLNSQSVSRIFSSLRAAQINDFFIGWVKTMLGEGSVCYDVTSISSYAKEMSSVERGYNRDGEDLAQFNLGMFCDEISKTPLYYNRYNGSLTDKTNLSYVLANAKDVGINRVKMILDGGFWSEGCIVSLKEACEAFTVGMPMHLKESQRLLATYGNEVAKYSNELNSPHIYCMSINIEVSGIKGRALLYFDAQNHVRLCGELSEHINRLKSELASLKRYPKSKLKRYMPYFTLTKHENNSSFEYGVDVDKVEKLRKTKGFFLIFSTDMESSPEDILYYYRAKDVSEKLFAQIKCDMDSNRIRTHNEQTTDGKTFVTFIACVIRSYLLNKLNHYLTHNSTSMKKVLSQLSNISILSSSRGLRFTKALSKKQKDILRLFGNYDDISKSIL